MDQLASTITDHLQQGDSYYNQAVASTNKLQYEPALTQANNAFSEFDLGRSSTQEALIYAKNSKKQVYIDYFQLTLQEMDLRLNATSELKMAIPYLQGNETTNANQHLGLANDYMKQSLALATQKEQLVQQNAGLFK
jgi:antitoxin component YwqK of YwqJK toxin-antitoxin module